MESTSTTQDSATSINLVGKCPIVSTRYISPQLRLKSTSPVTTNLEGTTKARYGFNFQLSLRRSASSNRERAQKLTRCRKRLLPDQLCRNFQHFLSTSTKISHHQRSYISTINVCSYSHPASLQLSLSREHHQKSKHARLGSHNSPPHNMRRRPRLNPISHMLHPVHDSPMQIRLNVFNPTIPT